MQTITVKDYVDRAGEIIKAAAAEIADDADKIAKLKYDKAAVDSRRDLTADGKNQEAAKLNHEIFVLNQHIEDVRNEANKKVRAIRDEVTEQFWDYYNAVPQDLDEKVVALINSGAVNENELLHMAKTANRTTRRIIGQALAKSKNDNIVFQGRVMQQASTNPHIDSINDVLGLGHFAMGSGLSGPDGARRFLEQWDVVSKAAYEKIPAVGCRVSDSGEREFFEEK